MAKGDSLSNNVWERKKNEKEKTVPKCLSVLFC